MVDGRQVEQVLADAGSARRRLSLVDVMSAGLPAVYSQFGDRLLYMDGRIFDATDPSSLAEIPDIAAGEAESTVGLEFGWQHAGGCTCRYCAGDRPARRERPTRSWRPEEARG